MDRQSPHGAEWQGLQAVDAAGATRGRQIISAEAKVLSQDGKVLAHGTSTLMVLNNEER